MVFNVILDGYVYGMISKTIKKCRDRWPAVRKALGLANWLRWARSRICIELVMH